MKFKLNAPKSKGEKQRTKWEFNKLKPGRGCVEIERKEEWAVAQRRAHAFGAHKKPVWKFSSQWLADEGIGRIRRVQ